MAVLSAAQVRAFADDGFVRLEEAFPRTLADECRALLWEQVRAETGAAPDDPATWTLPVHRIPGRGDPPFRRAATTDRLHGALDQLVGPGRWRPRRGLGTFPIRFPHADDPGDAGWHVEASFAGPTGEFRLNVRSRNRALLMLFLFSEVGEADAPTKVRIGSHRKAARLLAPYGDEGADFFAFAREAVPATDDLPVALATGLPGDVYLVHPFLVHSAQVHHGTRPRFMAQPPLDPTGLLDLHATDPTPVEEPVLAALAAG
ncbi:phytanoyl-CoA dioxygenase family protein [Pseudonocardia kujensis]|uniref:phytanoyl-CoA dioxygenase family protein n=1 Tax=Pseudonocardia kujensis TaxID=1128675 RepID=UPI001E521D46|nr:phytanoyl-CoA dioxygenase family protein [Pseudonocardia kujensis]MCE0763791.1 phytanoyl-CoA dioxygenase family protein [Pseudonocardia kujensis]